MKKVIVFVSVLLLLQLISFGQNLVINPSFETGYDTVISKFNSNVNYGDELVKNWYVPTNGTSDYYTGESSHINARTGKGRVGIISLAKVNHNSILLDFFDFPISEMKGDNYFSEYIRTKLNAPLIKGKKYCVKFYAASGPGGYYSKLGFLLTNNEIKYKTGLVVFEFDSLGQKLEHEIGVVNSPSAYSSGVAIAGRDYIPVSGIYEAKGGEEYLTIGNFDRNTLIKKKSFAKENPWSRGMLYEESMGYSVMSKLIPTAIYYIDDVSIEEVSLGQIKGCEDETANVSDSLTVIKYNNNYTFLIDASNSMNRYKDVLGSQFKDLQGLISENDNVNIFSFNSTTKLIYSDASNLDSINSIMDSVDFRGGTKIKEALKKTFTYTKSNRPSSVSHNSYVVLITDGDFDVDKEIKKIISKYAYYGINLKIIDVNRKKSKALNKVCSKNNGEYLHLSKDLDLTRILE